MKNTFLRQALPSAALMISALGTVLLTANLATAGDPDTHSRSHPQIAQADPWVSEVRGQLRRFAQAGGLSGYSETHNPFVGRLGRGGQDEITLRLRQGVRYAIVGVCDSDCRDIDLSLFDDNGRLVSSDTQGDDTPVVSVTPAWTAEFTIRVNMVRCSNNPCRFGVGALGR